MSIKQYTKNQNYANISKLLSKNLLSNYRNRVILPGIGHVPRPRNFTIENIVFIGIFPCKLPFKAVFTRPAFDNPDSILGIISNKKAHSRGIGVFIGDLTGNRTRIVRMRTWCPNR